jgi:nitrite reductase (NADH) small subunit
VSATISARRATRHVVGPLEDLPPGTTRVVQIGRRSIGIVNVEGALYGVANVCPHQGAPLFAGMLGGAMLPGAVGEYELGS